MSSQFNATEESSLATDLEQNTNLRLSKEEIRLSQANAYRMSQETLPENSKDHQRQHKSRNLRLEYSSSDSSKNLQVQPTQTIPDQKLQDELDSSRRVLGGMTILVEEARNIQTTLSEMHASEKKMTNLNRKNSVSQLLVHPDRSNLLQPGGNPLLKSV